MTENEAPVRVTGRRAALTVLVAPLHLGASPSAGVPDSSAGARRRVLVPAAGREG